MCEGAFDNQEAPFEKVVDAVQPGRDLSRSALFQVMFSYVRSGMSDAAIPGLTLRGMEVESGTSKFELTLEVTETPRGLACIFEYNSDLFARATVRRMIHHFQTLLQAMLDNADRRISDFPVIPEEEGRFLLRELNAEEALFPSAQTLQELFEVQAAKTPDASAVEYLGRVLTYGELNRRANQLARVLRRAGVGPERLCGLCMERSVEMMVGIVGILKAGGAYVALDPTYPRDRLQMIAEDAGLCVVLTLASSASSVPAGPWTVVTLDIDGPAIASEEAGNLPGIAMGDNLAYLIYTSGSTGRPKGVMISHRSAVNLWMGLERAIYVRHAGRPLRTSLNAPLIFDASVQELVTLLSGHCLCIIPQEIRGDGPGLVAFIRTQKLDVVDCVPSQLKLMLGAGLLAKDAPWVPAVLLPGGEAVDEGTWKTVASNGATDAYNMYGPTECTVDSTICRFRDLAAQPSIGRPIVNVQHYVLDARLRPVPIGVAGELFIAGEGLARGYFNRPDLTAERFLPNPFAAGAGGRMYRTGDRVKYLPDGHLVYLERLDHQVKVRGFRIELGEIEVALERHLQVRQAAVVAQQEEGGEKKLVAYYLPQEGEIPGTELRAHLKATLPEHMIPVFFVAMKSFPLTPSGKLDRRALPKADPVKLLSGLEAIAPRTPAEETLAEIWKQVLRVPELGVRDNFFELGGDSILSIQVIARANEAGLRLTPRQLFQNPTIEALALAAGSRKAVAAQQEPVTGPVPLTPIQRKFFEEILDDPDHWNQAILLGIEGSLDGPVMREVVRHALVHHDALRMRFRRDGDAWVQWNEPPGADPPYEEVDLSGEPESEGRLREHAATVQRSLSLHEGPLLRVVRYLMPGGDRLLIVIHHLVVDGVSWRILLEDLRRLYGLLRQQLPAELPAKTTSFREWAMRLAEFAQTDAPRRELAYWTGELAAPPDPLPVDFVGGENREDFSAWVQTEFSVEETAALTGEEGKALNATIPELLLTGLLRAYERWAGKRVLRIEMEGHGREEFQDALDVTRTVGWFTTLFPVSLDLRGAIGPREELATVKDQLRRVPENGFGFGLLRYMSSDESLCMTMRSLGRAEISFNYLGHFDRAAATEGFRVIEEAVGQERSGRAQRSYLLDLSAKVMGGKLQLGLAYSRNYHRSETAETLLQSWAEEVRHVARQCGAFRQGEGIPVDHTEAGLSRAELQGIIQELDGRRDDE
jgi:amino acid adenylation domain-containing protein/non-ribosomal peptide synthase protein (TIGR01720 family)